MSNFFIACYKDYLKLFNREMQKINNEKSTNVSYYAESRAAELNNELDKKAEKELKNMKKKICDLHNEIVEKLAVNSFPTVESLTADRMFFDGSVNVELTPSVVGVFVKKFEDNDVMLSLISAWIDKQGNKDDYSTIKKQIALPEERAEIYKNFAVSAIDELEKLYNGTCSSWELETWANEDFAADLFAKIGTAAHLSDVSTTRVPAEAKNLLDDYKIDPNDSGATAVIQYTPLNRS